MTFIFAIFAFGVAVSLVVAKGIMQANDFAKEELKKLRNSAQDQ